MVILISLLRLELSFEGRVTVRYTPNTTIFVVAQMAEALYYKPEGRGFESPWGNFSFFQFT
jgi:hypothetical protein